MYLFVFIFNFIIMWPLGAWAQNSCLSSKRADELYNCILKYHPAEKAAQLSHEMATPGRERRTQLPNPELSYKSVSGDEAGGRVESTEVELTIDLTDLLVKRSALSKSGRAEEKMLRVQADEESFQVRSQIIKDLYRYRQLKEELELADEALQTFSKIAGQYRARKARGPDQDITLNLIELAQGDYQLKKNHLEVEKSEAEARYKGVFGDSFSFKTDWLPSIKKTWPAVTEAEISKNTFELRKAEADFSLAEAEHSIANREAWPRIAAGPAFEQTREGGRDYESTGFNISMTLPIFSQNGGAREFTEKKSIKAKYAYEYAIKKSSLEKQLLLQRYHSSVDSLKKSAGTSQLASKHSKIDGLFRQGLTSGPVVIEAHRQILEFTESQHEHEMTAIDSLLYLNLLAGKDLSEVLR
ncbi:MAG: TolC family protein [Bdellovibrionota bacterium]